MMILLIRASIDGSFAEAGWFDTFQEAVNSQRDKRHLRWRYLTESHDFVTIVCIEAYTRYSARIDAALYVAMIAAQNAGFPVRTIRTYDHPFPHWEY